MKLKYEATDRRTGFGRDYGPTMDRQQNNYILILFDTTEGTGAVDGSSVTMCTPFVPLYYQAIIMIEEV